MNIIGPQIKKYREKQKLTQKQLSEKLNLRGMDISMPVLSKIEVGERKVMDTEVLEFAKLFGIPIELLFKTDPTDETA